MSDAIPCIIPIEVFKEMLDAGPNVYDSESVRIGAGRERARIMAYLLRLADELEDSGDVGWRLALVHAAEGVTAGEHERDGGG